MFKSKVLFFLFLFFFKVVLCVPFADWLWGPLVTGREGVGGASRHRVEAQRFFWILVTPSAGVGLCCRWLLWSVMSQPVQPCFFSGSCLQASEGVPMRFFTKLDQLIEFYKKENMGLVTHLQYPVPLEEEEAGDEPEEETGRQGQRAGQGPAAAMGERGLRDPVL